MPIFLDRHDAVEFSAEEIAKLHVKDLEIQDLVFKPTGSETLKGFSEPVQLFSPVS